LRDSVDPATVTGIALLNWEGYLRNLIPVTLGNIIGGSGLVALVYHLVYRVGLRTVATDAVVTPHTAAAVQRTSASKA
jgi:hypothetical protein